MTDSFLLATCSRDSVKLWTVDEGILKNPKLVKHVRAPRCVSWNHSCHVLACGLEDGYIDLISATNLTSLVRLEHGEAVSHLAFNSTSRYLCSASKSFAKVFNLKAASADGGSQASVLLRVELSSPPCAVSFDVKQTRVCIADASGLCRIVPIAADNGARALDISSSKGFTAASFFSHPSVSTMVVTAEKCGVVSVWDATDGSLQWQIPVSSAHALGATSVACSQNDSMGDSGKFGVGVFATCGSDGLVNVFDIMTKEHKFQFSLQASLTQVSFLHDGLKFVVSDTTGSVQVLDSRVSAPLSQVKAHSSGIVSLAMAQRPKLKTARAATEDSRSVPSAVSASPSVSSSTPSVRGPAADIVPTPSTEATPQVPPRPTVGSRRSASNEPSSRLRDAASIPSPQPSVPHPLPAVPDTTATSSILPGERKLGAVAVNRETSFGHTATARPPITSSAKSPSPALTLDSADAMPSSLGNVSQSPLVNPRPSASPAVSAPPTAPLLPAGGGTHPSSPSVAVQPSMSTSRMPSAEAASAGSTPTSQHLAFAAAAVSSALKAGTSRTPVVTSQPASPAREAPATGPQGLSARFTTPAKAQSPALVPAAAESKPFTFSSTEFSGTPTLSPHVIREAVLAVVEPMLDPIHHSVKNLHLELLRQSHIQRVELAKQLTAFQQQTASMSQELEALREENARLKQMWRA